MPILDLDNKNLVEKYEAFIKKSPHGHMMQSINWSKVKNNWDKDYVYLQNDRGEIEAAISLLSVKNDGENAFMYAPRGPVCDLDDLDLVERLIEEATEVAKKRKAFLLRIDPEVRYDSDLVEKYRAAGYNVRSREQEDEKTFSNPRNNMVLDIKDKTIDDMMAFFSGKQRNKIRKTYKRNLQTRIISADNPELENALDRFYDLTKIMAERQGISYRPYDYFVRLLEAFDDVNIFETYDEEDEVLSSSIIVNYNKKTFYLYSASSNNKRNFNASTQMNYEAIQYATTKNMEEYDFGGIYGFDSSDGLYAFKYDFCGKEGRKELIGEIDIVFDQALYEKFLNN